MNAPQYPCKVSRLCHGYPDDQIRNAIASVTLSGLRPTEAAVELLKAVVHGKMTSDKH